MDFFSFVQCFTILKRRLGLAAHRQGLALAALTTLASFLVLFVVSILPFSSAQAQNKVDLEDMTIKGELVNDDRLRMSSRDSQSMKEKIGYRANFRKEIVDNKEVSWPETEAASNPTSENRREPSSIAMPSLPSLRPALSGSMAPTGSSIPHSPSLPRVGSTAGAQKKAFKPAGKP